MELRPMTPPEVERWYAEELAEAFPPNERKPLSDILEEMAAGGYEALGLYEDGALLGYATLWSRPAYPGYVLLDYLGVTAARRNGGLGARLLALLEERCRGRALVITEAECPVPGGDPAENDLRARRIAFYERCGFRRVYETGACGTRFQALVLGEPPEDRAALMEAHRAIYGPGRADVRVPLPPGAIPRPPRWMKG